MSATAVLLCCVAYPRVLGHNASQNGPFFPLGLPTRLEIVELLNHSRGDAIAQQHAATTPMTIPNLLWLCTGCVQQDTCVVRCLTLRREFRMYCNYPERVPGNLMGATQMHNVSNRVTPRQVETSRPPLPSRPIPHYITTRDMAESEKGPSRSHGGPKGGVVAGAKQNGGSVARRSCL